MSDKSCNSCGMPIRSTEDAAGGNLDNDYCRNCAHDSGELKSYEEVLAGMTEFVVTAQGLDEAVAQQLAEEMLRKLPAWRES